MFNDYISLTVGPGDGPHRRSLWRTWNQLSRLQRSLLYVLIVIFLVIFSYWVLNPNKVDETIIYKTVRNTQQPKKEPDPEKSRVEAIVAKVDAEVKEILQTSKEVVQHSNILEGNVFEIGHLGPPEEAKMTFNGPQNDRQLEVVNAFMHAWQGYRKFAWGHDMLRPISKYHHDWFALGLSIVDSLDTMYIMGLTKEFDEAREWIHESLTFNVNKDVNLFEVTIRVLGGLLSAFHLSQDSMFLEKANDLGMRLLPCFDTESGVPFSDVNLATQVAHSPKWSPDSSTSEVTTLQLEFRDLSRTTGNPRFETAAAKVSAHVHKLSKTDGLVPIFINANTGEFRTFSTITLGARGDSYYEYLLKQWIQTGRTIEYLKEDYMEAMNGVKKLLVRRTSKSKLLFVGELLSGGKDFKPKMDHLTCYLSGTLALGVHYGMPADHMDLAHELLNTCYQTYAVHPTFLAPEISYFNIQDSSQNDIYVKTNDAHSLLRPEFLESLWIMYQLTGNKTYQDWGYTIFQSFEKYAKVTHGYTSLGNVKNPSSLRPKDMMESFFLGETLKYLYLLFSDDRQELSLDHFVMNTEAHPFPIHNS